MKKFLKYIFIAIFSFLLILVAFNIDKIKFTYELFMSYKNLKNIEEDESLSLDMPNSDNIEVVQNPIEKLPIYNDEPTDENNTNENINKEPEDIASDQIDNKNNSNDKNDRNENTNNIKNSNKADSTDKTDNTDINISEDDNTDIKDTNESNEQLYYDIVEKYYNILTEMQKEYEAKINNLIEEGYEEYKSGSASVLELANKYLSLGTDLEKESDKKVEAILDEMEKELVSNNLDTSILTEIKEYYNYLKDLRRSQLISKAKEHMK